MSAANLPTSGFFVIDNSVMDLLPKIKPTGYAIYSYLVKMADRDGYCHPSQKTIGKAVGVTDRVVRTYLTLLEATGLVSTERVEEGDSRKLCYVVTAPYKQRNPASAIKEKRNVASGNLENSGSQVPVDSGSYVPLEQKPENKTPPAHEAANTEPPCDEEIFGSDARNVPAGPPALTPDQREAAKAATKAVFSWRLDGDPTWREWGVWQDAFTAGLKPEDATRFALAAKDRWDRRNPDDPARSMVLFKPDILAAVRSPQTKTATLSAAELERRHRENERQALQRVDPRAMAELGFSQREIAEMMGAAA